MQRPDLRTPDLEFHRRERVLGLPVGRRRTDWVRIGVVGVVGAAAASALAAAGKAVAGRRDGRDGGEDHPSAVGSGDGSGDRSAVGRRRKAGLDRDRAEVGRRRKAEA